MPTGTITALRAQEHDKQRVNVFIDDSFAIGVSLNTISSEGLYVGKTLDEAAWFRLESVESADKAFQSALRFLNARPRSTAEVSERLRQKDFPPESIEVATNRLTQLGLLDDTAFSRFWIENRQLCRPRGKRALRDELHRKGIARDVVEAALSDETLTGDEAARALTLARAALRKYADAPDRASFQRRLGGYLQRRGFGLETIIPIMDRLWQELRSRSDDDDETTG